MPGDVWVVVEHQQGEVEPVTFEMLDEARNIANRLQAKLVGLLLGHQLPDVSGTLAGFGADLVYLVDHPLLAQYTTDAHTLALADLVKARDPFLVLLASTANGQDLASRLAVRLGAALASDCVMLKLGPDRSIEATRPTYADKVYSTYVLASPPPFVATLKPGVIGVGRPDRLRRARTESVEVQLDPSSLWTRSAKMVKSDPATLDVSEAEIVVSGGRGLGSAERWHLLQDLAGALGGCLAGSRMAVDQGWIPSERMVGQTGKSIGPKVYFAVGISGAREHLAGLREARNVVAINKDPHAPIFSRADKKVVGDLAEVLPVLIRKLKRLREAEAGQHKADSR
ncbi:MAG: electron transfer flavoprotein subunit alpha/FixB family protein [Chloroflexi bacterium]|nr:electron transfer flavoprotein subunit alpha/FixB family protein [Chloroflexota bacterium]